MADALPLILASSSPYRRQLLQRLGLIFQTRSPDIDERAHGGEAPGALVRRLAETKAREVARNSGPALIIASDQVSVRDGHILGKPGSVQNAREQLRAASGKAVQFLTSLCLLNTCTDDCQMDVVTYTVHFRQLSDAQITHYVERELPLDCAGAFKSEGLGVALFKRMEGDDPTALIGLPLIRLVQFLENEGVRVV